MFYTREQIKLFYNIPHEQQLEMLLEELAIHIEDIRELRQYCVQLAKYNKHYGIKFTVENYFNCIRNEKYEYLRRDNILCNLLGYNGDIKQIKTFENLEKAIQKIEATI